MPLVLASRTDCSLSRLRDVSGVIFRGCSMETAEPLPLIAEGPLEAGDRRVQRPSLLGRMSRAHWAGSIALLAAFALSWVNPLWAVAPLAGFLGLCLLAPPFPRWGFFLPIFSAGPRTLNAVALTFDDGPDPVSTLPLLEVLSRHGLKAAFFVVGDRAEAHPELIREILSRGHEIGNHSRRHDVFLMLRSYGVLESEVVGCQEILHRQGVKTLAFRPPVGITNSRLRGVLERLGMYCVCFECRPLDFGNRRVSGLSQRVLRTAVGGDIVLLHDCQPKGGVEPWLAEVEAILQGLARKGIEVLPLSELLGRPVMELDGRQGGRS